MKKTLFAVIVTAFTMSCVKDRNKKDKPADTSVEQLDSDDELESKSETEPSLTATLTAPDSSGNRSVIFSSHPSAKVSSCRNVPYQFQVEGAEDWHSQVDGGLRNPYTVDGQLQPGSPGDLGCDSVVELNLNGLETRVLKSELVLIRAEPLGEERLELIPDAAEREITAATEIEVYEHKPVTAIRFNFEYNQGENTFEFTQEFKI